MACAFGNTTTQGVPLALRGAAMSMPAHTRWRTDQSLHQLYGNEKINCVERGKFETRFADLRATRDMREHKMKQSIACPFLQNNNRREGCVPGLIPNMAHFLDIYQVRMSQTLQRFVYAITALHASPA